MSKGKQWWPILATSHDTKEALVDFQERLRQKQWLRKDNPAFMYHIYLKEGTQNTPLQSVNDYMQFSQQDQYKNLLRSQVLRALCMLLKWQILLKHDAVIADVPTVFLIPSIDQTNSTHVGIVAVLQWQNKQYTIIISEKNLDDPLSFGHSFFGKSYGKTKHWMCAQTGDSYKWLTVKSWSEQRKKASFGKWVFGLYQERKSLVASLTDEKNADENGSPYEVQTTKHKALIDNKTQEYKNREKELGLFGVETQGDKPQQEKEVGLLRAMNAVWSADLKKWFLPEFLDEDAFLQYLQQERLSLPPSKPVTKYNYQEKSQDHLNHIQTHQREHQQSYKNQEDEHNP